MADSLSQDDLEHIRQLLKLVEDNALTDLKVVQPDGLTVEIATGAAPPAHPGYALMPAPAPHYAAGAPGSPYEVEAVAAPAPASKGIPLESPMVGIFYRAQTPEDPPFAREGEVVQIGQPIGLIEAMKVFSEIPAERSGRILSFAASNGQLVQLGQPIAYVEPV